MKALSSLRAHQTGAEAGNGSSRLHAAAVLTVDLDAIVANYRKLKEVSGGRSCAAVLKADAYGMGATRVGPALAAAGCLHFFVAHLDEGAVLREALPRDCEIFVLNGCPPGAETDMRALRLTPVLNSLEQAAGWAASAGRSSTGAPAAIQVDSGMARLGLSLEECEKAAPLLRRLDLRLILSHLSWAEEPEHPANRKALAAFQAARKILPSVPASLANSSGVFLGPDYHFDLLRPGAALYGIAPQVGRPNPMRQVLRLQGRIIQTRWIEPDVPVGYNGRFVAPGRRRIATVGVGYADGYLRCLGGQASAGVGGFAAPVVGAVSMDLITVDVTDAPDSAAGPGAWVDLIGGGGPSLDSLGKLAGTIGYEILTSLGSRYCRIYVGDETGV